MANDDTRQKIWTGTGSDGTRQLVGNGSRQRVFEWSYSLRSNHSLSVADKCIWNLDAEWIRLKLFTDCRPWYFKVFFFISTRSIKRRLDIMNFVVLNSDQIYSPISRQYRH